MNRRRAIFTFGFAARSYADFGLGERFINKANDWALRQYAWTNPAPVKKFVKATKELHPLNRREALKNIG